MVRSAATTHSRGMTLRIVPIDAAFADAARAAHTPTIVTEPYSAPCRVCLEDAHVGDAVLLCRYSPFERDVPYRTEGPVFVHAQACMPFRPGAPPTDALRRRLLSLRAYDAAGMMVACEVGEGRELERLATELFADRRVEVVHVHHARAGCFACRIERAR
jgi:Protein of unknown function (DUF1203)